MRCVKYDTLHGTKITRLLKCFWTVYRFLSTVILTAFGRYIGFQRFHCNLTDSLAEFRDELRCFRVPMTFNFLGYLNKVMCRGKVIVLWDFVSFRPVRCGSCILIRFTNVRCGISVPNERLSTIRVAPSGLFRRITRRRVVRLWLKTSFLIALQIVSLIWEYFICISSLFRPDSPVQPSSVDRCATVAYVRLAGYATKPQANCNTNCFIRHT